MEIIVRSVPSRMYFDFDLKGESQPPRDACLVHAVRFVDELLRTQYSPRAIPGRPATRIELKRYFVREASGRPW